MVGWGLGGVGVIGRLELVGLNWLGMGGEGLGSRGENGAWDSRVQIQQSNSSGPKRGVALSSPKRYGTL